MSKHSLRSQQPSLKNTPFEELVVSNADLAELRREYASVPAEKRRAAAEWAYDSSLGSHIFNGFLARFDPEALQPERWPPGVEALAINPDCVPALFTVGAAEYELGREGEAMRLFGRLLDLPPDTDGLVEAVDQAGTFLIEQEDYDCARQIYARACELFPQDADCHNGLGYVFARQGRHAEVIPPYERAVELEPDNAEFLNDLGWAHVECGHYDEAERVLRRAMELAEPEYVLPRNNLQELQKRKARH